MGYRDDVKNAARDILLGNTVAGDNVFTTMDRPISPDDLPIIIIYTVKSERGEEYGRGLTTRVVTVRIEAALAVQNPYTAEAVAEAFADEAEKLLNADPAWGGAVTFADWQETVSDVSSIGETIIANVLVEYRVTVYTDERDDAFFGVTDEGFNEPPSVVTTRPDVYNPVIDPVIQPPTDTACGPDGCDIPAWGGEI